MKKYRKLTEDEVETILSQIDFVRVLKAMKGLKWKYGNGYPSIASLILDGRKLLYQLENGSNDTHSLATGGFEAFREYPGTKWQYYGLRFVVEEGSTQQ